ncbi:MAG: rhodanese-like domain-containing protein [Pseudomonadota bacterium]
MLNISGYHFKPLSNLPVLQEQLRQRGAELHVKGTIILSEEGTNFFLAGPTEAVDALHGQIEQLLDTPIPVRKSYSDVVPFKKLMVRLRSELIKMGHPATDPTKTAAPYVFAEKLKTWLDQGHDDNGQEIIVLDTRNTYETHLGKFEDAQCVPIEKFTEFPAAVQQLPEDWKKKTVVTYCTGGIRCEKAALYMQEQGFEHVYQLHGGILSYFEHCGNEHWTGECFIFDKRMGVNSDLSVSETVQCHHCRAPVNIREQADPSYEVGVSCIHCIDKK